MSTFASLREILADTHLSDSDRWAGICRVFEGWESGEEREQALAYAEAHLAEMPVMERNMYRFTPDAPYWPLVRCLRMTSDYVKSVLEATDTSFSHITKVYGQGWGDCEDLDVFAPFHGLEELSLYYCHDLVSIEGLQGLPSFRHLHLGHGYTSSNRPFPEACLSLPSLTQLESLHLDGFFQPNRLGWFEGMGHLKELHLYEYEGALQDLSFLSSLQSLKTLSLRRFQGFSDLNALLDVVPDSLESLSLGDCKTLHTLEGIERLPALRKLRLAGCDVLRSLDHLEQLPALEELEIVDCDRLRDISAVGALSHLHTLFFSNLPKVNDISALEGLEGLRHLSLRDCRAIGDIGPLSSCRALEMLHLTCKKLDDLSSLSGLDALVELSLSDCLKLEHLDDLATLVSLKVLKLEECKTLSSIAGIGGLVNLVKLLLQGCKALTDLSPVVALVELREVSLYYSRSIKDVTPLCYLPHLDSLDLTGCSGIKKSLRSRHWGQEALTAWRSRAMPKSALPRKKAQVLPMDHSILPGVSPQVEPDEEHFVLDDYKPPSKKKEAEALAAYGNRVLPLLKPVPKQKSGAASAAIKTLGLIGTPEALDVLMEYREEKRQAPLKEIIRMAHRFGSEGELEIGETILAPREPKALKIDGIGLQSLRCLSPVTSLEVLNLSQNRELSDLSPLRSLVHLRDLDLAVCSAVSDLSPLSDLRSLETLRLYWMPVSDLSPLSGLLALRDLELHGMRQISALTPLSSLPALSRLRLTMCSSFESLAPLFSLPVLEDLTLDWSQETSDLSGLGALPLLRRLTLSMQSSLSDFSSLGGLAASPLEYLQLSGSSASFGGATENEVVAMVGEFASLRRLDLSLLELWSDPQPLAGLAQLESLMLFYARSLVFDAFPSLPSLRALDLTSCSGLVSLEWLLGMKELRSLRLAGCQALRDISALRELPDLKSLTIYNCPNVEDKGLLEELGQVEGYTIS